jgi:hypothetical protein
MRALIARGGRETVKMLAHIAAGQQMRIDSRVRSARRLAVIVLLVLFGGARSIVARLEAAPDLALVAPQHGDVVPGVIEVQVRSVGVVEDVHLLVTDPTDATKYRYIARFPVIRSGGTETLSRIVDISQLGSDGTVRLVAVSMDLNPPVGGEFVDAARITSASAADSIEVRLAGQIRRPEGAAPTGAMATVRIRCFLPGRHVAVVVQPVAEGGYWVQNHGVAVSSLGEIAMRVHFGGVGDYYLYLGVSDDSDAFVEGNRLTHLPGTDRSGRPIHWVGPVTMTRP